MYYILFIAPSVVRYRNAVWSEEIGLYQLGLDSVVKSDASERYSKQHFSHHAVFPRVRKVELIVVDQCQII